MLLLVSFNNRKVYKPMSSRKSMTRDTSQFRRAMAPLDLVAKVGNAGKRTKDKRGDIRVSGERELKEAALGILRYFEPEAYNGTSVDNLTNDEINGALTEDNIKLLQENAANIIYRNSDGVIDSMPEKALAGLGLTETVKNEAKGADAELVQKYTIYRGLENIIQRYNAGERLSEDEEKILANGVGRQRGKELADRLDGEYSPNAVHVLSKLAELAYSAGRYSRDHVQKAGSKIVKNAKDDYESFARSRGKGIEQYAGETAKAIITDGDGEKFDKLMGSMYSAEQGDIAGSIRLEAERREAA